MTRFRFAHHQALLGSLALPETAKDGSHMLTKSIGSLEIDSRRTAGLDGARRRRFTVLGHESPPVSKRRPALILVSARWSGELNDSSGWQVPVASCSSGK
jgi:hypothetical protein